MNFSQEQYHRLLRHAWELGNAYFDYYFFKENCAYHILSLLEVADPNLHLTDQFHFATIPADTIRLLTRQKELVQKITYRPARSTLLKRKREALTKEEAALVPKTPSRSSDNKPIRISSIITKPPNIPSGFRFRRITI